MTSSHSHEQTSRDSTISSTPPFLREYLPRMGGKLFFFEDVNQKPCSLQESSVEPGCIAFGINNALMSLNREQVRDLLPHLTSFAETGHL